jgi:hypothetical protein
MRVFLPEGGNRPNFRSSVFCSEYSTVAESRMQVTQSTELRVLLARCIKLNDQFVTACNSVYFAA